MKLFSNLKLIREIRKMMKINLDSNRTYKYFSVISLIFSFQRCKPHLVLTTPAV